MRDIFALPVKEGGFNIPRLESRIQAFRLNTLKRLLSGEEAHWKSFTAYFFRVSNMKLGKLTLALEYSLQRINRDVPAFLKELLSAWFKHSPCRVRTHVPVSRRDILKEPLFLNKQITVDEVPRFYADWIAAGLTRVKDICYEAVPGFLPILAMHEILTEQRDPTLSRTRREYRLLVEAAPRQWIQQVCSESARPPSLQPRFNIQASSPNQDSLDILSCKTRHFYGQISSMHKPVIPAVATWKRTLQPEPAVNSKQWGILYSPLVSNKQGDINWRIAHRVLPTALSLHRMTVYDSPFCHRCGLFVAFIDKLKQNNLPLITDVKLLGKIHKPSDPFNKRSMDLVNWTLTVARYAIFQSAVYHRKDNQTMPPEAIFTASIKSHLRFQFRLFLLRRSQNNFQDLWCIREAFAKVLNNNIVFTF